MKNNLPIYIVVIAAVSTLFWFLFFRNSPTNLVSPFAAVQTQTSPTPSPSPSPIQYNFDKSTDLKSELNTIQPEIQDSDFSNLKQIASGL